MVRQICICVLVGTTSLACAQAKRDSPGRAVVDVLFQADAAVIEARVPRHATLDSLLRQHQLSADLVNAAVRSAAAVFNPRKLRADRPYRLVLSFDGFLREFEYEIDTDRFLRIISRDSERPQALDAEVVPFEKESNVVAIRGQIDATHPSLISAMGESGENIQLAMALADVFGGEIDFNSGLQRGDAFEVLFEKSTRSGEFAGYGAIHAATFVTNGRTHKAFRWVNPETGKPAYYDEQGRSLKRFFLVSPLKFEPRVTSHFSRSRVHPVHNVLRAHTGVDYGAPHGAAVIAVADGTVVTSGWAGGGGNQVRIRHEGGIETLYMHLSAYGPGIRAGVRVDQGQLIGRVGATGTATGPHLHFSLRKNNVFVDPVAERRRQPPGEPISAVHLPEFQIDRDSLLDRMQTTLVAADSARQQLESVRAAQ